MNQQTENIGVHGRMEVTVLGAGILDAEAVAQAVEHLDDTDFVSDAHRRIFRAMSRMQREGRPVDFVTLLSELSKTKELDAVGGQGYLAFLTEGVPRAMNIASYLEAIKTASGLRHAHAVLSEAQKEIEDGGGDPADIIARTKVELETIAESVRDSSMEHFGAYLTQRFKSDPEAVFVQSAKLQGVRTGFDKFDAMTSTLQPQDLWVVAARASMGKTAWATSLIGNVVLRPHRPSKVAAFFMEQSKKSAMGRLLCGAAQASFKRFRDGELWDTEKSRIRAAMNDFLRSPLYWSDEEDLTTSEIAAKCRRLKREQGLDLIVIDQLSFISAADFYRKGMQRDEIVGEKVKRAKKIAKDLGVPVILLAQVGRSATTNKDSKPTLKDLAESGQIEQHADGVAFLHRASYYDRSDQDLRGKGEQIIAKHRDGPTGDIDCEYLEDSCLWRDKIWKKVAGTEEMFGDAY